MELTPPERVEVPHDLVSEALRVSDVAFEEADAVAPSHGARVPAPRDEEGGEEDERDEKRSRHGSYFGPLDASRKTASACSSEVPRSLPFASLAGMSLNAPNFGITVFPNLDGSET